MSRDASFFRWLRRKTSPRWAKVFAHPFLAELAEGSLARDRFRFFLRQDYCFLVEYARTLALGAAKARSLDHMTRMAELAHGALTFEMTGLLDFCQRQGLSRAELLGTEPSPTMRAYVDNLVRAGYQEQLPGVCAALLPCQYSYWEIGKKLERSPVTQDERHPYAEWIALYASKEYEGLAIGMRDLLDELARDCSEAEQAHLAELYRVGVDYELAFWNMAYRMGG